MALAQTSQFSIVSMYECGFLSARPPFQLAFTFARIFDIRVTLKENQLHRSPFCCENSTLSLVVRFYT